jgi:hypothetical protein
MYRHGSGGQTEAFACLASFKILPRLREKSSDMVATMILCDKINEKRKKR